MICSSRANLPQVQTKAGEIRQNRWVRVEYLLFFLGLPMPSEDVGPVLLFGSISLFLDATCKTIDVTLMEISNNKIVGWEIIDTRG